MPDVFWFGLGFPALGLLLGFVGGVRSHDGVLAGTLTGLFLGSLAGFPLLAIGLSTS
jgi:hypothetical protein